MKRLLLLIVALFAASCASHTEEHWSYWGETGPSHWADLNPEFKDAIGHAQSPIDITPSAVKLSDNSTVEIHYIEGAFYVANNGHTIELSPIQKNESYMDLDGERYYLQQFHFHSPSEHTVNAYAYDMEIHFVNRSESGKLAVMGVFCKEGKVNRTLLEIWRNMPLNVEEHKPLPEMVVLTNLIPPGGRVYRYEGSLTTPPTREGVSWVLFDTNIEVSRMQISKFGLTMGENARPVQPLEDRTVTSYRNGRQ